MGPDPFSLHTMTTEEKKHVKYAESTAAYKATLYRSAFAIRGELEPGLKQIVELSGAPSVSGMLSMLAQRPEEFARLLKPGFEEIKAQPAPERRRLKVTMKSVVDEMKSGELTPEEIAQAIAAAKAAKQQREGA